MLSHSYKPQGKVCMEHDNHQNTTIEFVVEGDYALFSDPITRVGGEKCSYMIPTYDALRGICDHIYYKPTIRWVIDEVRIMNQISMETKGVKKMTDKASADLSYNTYIKNPQYQVRAHFEWNLARPDLEHDRDWRKHIAIARRYLERGGSRESFLGTSECTAYVEPCVFGNDSAYYDNATMDFGLMYHSIDYHDDRRNGDKDVRFWIPKMENGVIRFARPNDCDIVRELR